MIGAEDANCYLKGINALNMLSFTLYIYEMCIYEDMFNKTMQTGFKVSDGSNMNVLHLR